MDVIENLHVLFDGVGNVIMSHIDGIIKMKSYLTGKPQLKMTLNLDSYFDDYSFHESVAYKDFEFNR